MTGDQEQDAPARRVSRRTVLAGAPAAVAAASGGILGDARSETRGRPADGGGLSREEIALRIGDDQFQDNPELLTRRKMGHTQIDKFTVPKHLMKPGWDYEFKTRRIMGEAVSPTDVGFERNQGWRPVPAADMREMLAPDYDKPVVEFDGQILMMRPMRLSREARNEMISVADSQKREKLQQAMVGPSDQDPRMPRRVLNDQFDSHVREEVGTYRPPDK